MPDKKQIQGMFNNIAGDYDRLNHILSLDVDSIWRRKAVREIVPDRVTDSFRVLDLACGTGDFSIAIADRIRSRALRGEVVGVDLSEGMLEVMRKKVDASPLRKYISAQTGDGENLPFDEGSFDRVAIGFGIRNFENRTKGLREMLRVLKPGGKVVLLELSLPKNSFVLSLYKGYFLHLMPLIGGAVSGNRKAYKYLPASVLGFPPAEKFVQEMTEAGFCNVSHRSFTFGICRMYVGEKASEM